jgi:hypothetical protein
VRLGAQAVSGDSDPRSAGIVPGHCSIPQGLLPFDDTAALASGRLADALTDR